MKTPLTWVGNKTKVLPTIRSLFTKIGPDVILVEPFAGSAAVSFELERKYTILGDTAKNLILFYHILSRYPQQLMFQIDVFGENTKENYYKNRELYNRINSYTDCRPIDIAALFYVLNKQCYRGLMRYNKKGHFNTPYGYRETTWMRLPYDLARDYSNLMYGWRLFDNDFEYTIREAQGLSNDPHYSIGPLVYYLDPPYFTQRTSKFYEGSFDISNDVKYLDLLKDDKSPIIISNSGNKIIKDLYKFYNYDIIELQSKTALHQGVSDREEKTEIVAYRNIEV